MYIHLAQDLQYVIHVYTGLHRLLPPGHPLLVVVIVKGVLVVAVLEAVVAVIEHVLEALTVHVYLANK